MKVLDLLGFLFNVLKFLLAISPLLLIVLIFVKNNNPKPKRPGRALDSDDEDVVDYHKVNW